jgi:hypothetical protein
MVAVGNALWEKFTDVSEEHTAWRKNRSSFFDLLFYSGMEAESLSDTRVNFYQTARRHNSHESTAVLTYLQNFFPRNSKVLKEAIQRRES